MDSIQSADIYIEHGRPELAEKELSEKRFIDEYLPKMMSDIELRDVIKNIFIENNVTSIKQMGVVMKILKDKYSGEYDPSMASFVIKEMLKN